MSDLSKLMIEGLNLHGQAVKAVVHTVEKIEERARIVEDLAKAGFGKDHPVWQWLRKEDECWPARKLGQYLAGLNHLGDTHAVEGILKQAMVEIETGHFIEDSGPVAIDAVKRALEAL